MAIYRMYRDGDVVEVEGSADHLTQEFLPASADSTLQAVLIAGLLRVTRVGDGQHNGASARTFTLTDETGLYEVGRLVVRNDMSLEWSEVYESPEAAERRVKEWQNESEVANAIAEATVDFAWSETYPSLAFGMATVAAEYGVSVTKHSDNGGGGWPEIKVVGLREKVVRLLKDGWQYSDEMVAEELG